MIIRPYKFLRKWINFELRFGEDMILDKSRSQIRKEFEKKWKDIISEGKNYLIEFLRSKMNNDLICSFDLPKFKRKYYKDPSFYTEFNDWKKEKIKLEKLKQNYYSHLDRIRSDFSKSPYLDKIEQRDEVYKRTYIYTFEDGEKSTFTIEKDKNGEYSSFSEASASFIESGKSQSISFSGFSILNKLIILINFINENSKKRNHEEKNISNKKRRYDLLKKTLSAYQEQLQKEKNSGTDYTHTLNEIYSLEDRISEMKEKYKL